MAAARTVAELTRAGRLLSVAGGGDTVAALALAGVEKDFSYVSAAGGAFLEWLEGKELPGVKALHEIKEGKIINLDELNRIARKMVQNGKGLLAADKSTTTIGKRFDAIGVTNTEDNRRDYREFLFRSTTAMKDHISGVILYDETLRQKAKDGTPLVKLIEAADAVPGIKVDMGAKPLAGAPGETITEGLDGLRERFIEYHKLGARFAKWRAVVDIGANIPSYNCINANAQALARYAALAQENGIVPIIEPEVLMDGDHDLERCEKVTSWTLEEVFNQLFIAGVKMEGMILKPNMIVPGKKSAKQASVEEVAKATVRRAEAPCAAGCAGHCLPVGRPVGRGRHGPSAGDQRHRRIALALSLLLWPRPAGSATGSLGWQDRECRRGAGRLCPPRPDELARGQRQMEQGRREEGGLN